MFSSGSFDSLLLSGQTSPVRLCHEYAVPLGGFDRSVEPSITAHALDGLSGSVDYSFFFAPETDLSSVLESSQLRLVLPA